MYIYAHTFTCMFVTELSDAPFFPNLPTLSLSLPLVN